MNKIQKIVLKLLEMINYNNFNGKEVAKDLEKNEKMWQGFILGRFAYFTLIPLRDIDADEGYYNCDTIMIKLPKTSLNWLVKMAEKWKVDEFGYYLNGELEGVVDENLTGLNGKEKNNHFYLSLGSNPENDTIYARLWWD